jgi:hypothetical protein
MSTGRANSRANIAFVIYYPFQFYVYKNVYQYLKDRAEFLIDLGHFFPNRQTDDVLPAIEALLQKHGAAYRIIQHEDYFFTRHIKEA